MLFRQPSELSRVLDQMLTDMLEGKTVTFRFETAAQLGQVLAALQEVADSRQVVVAVRACGRRRIELTLAEAPAPTRL